MAELPPTFSMALEANRDELNARFAARMRGGNPIDGAAFLRHLESSVAPLVTAVHKVLPERSSRVVSPLFDVSLDLFSAGQLGSEAKSLWVQCVWDNLLPVAAPLLAREPLRVAGCLSNAMIQIASQRGTRPQMWLDRMQQVGRQCESVSELLSAGAIAAWQAGMVQFRHSALTVAMALRPPLAAAALGIVSMTNTDDLQSLIGRLQAHRWLSVESTQGDGSTAEISLAGTAGAFSGFGGEFFRPPEVSVDGDRLFVSDTRSEWELVADAYGSWFRRCGDAPVKPQQKPARTETAIDSRGTIRWGKQTLSQPHLAGASSFAATSQTLAVTIPTSHHVFLFSGPGTSA